MGRVCNGPLILLKWFLSYHYSVAQQHYLERILHSVVEGALEGKQWLVPSHEFEIQVLMKQFQRAQYICLSSDFIFTAQCKNCLITALHAKLDGIFDRFDR